MEFPTHTYGPDEPCQRQCDLLVIVVAWRRPDMLLMTLESLTERLSGLDYCLTVAINESSPEMESVTRRFSNVCVNTSPTNRGINRAIEDVLPVDAGKQFKYVMVTDADIYYQLDIANAIQMLETHPLGNAVGMFSFQHAPETPVLQEKDIHQWATVPKRYDRCGMMLMKAERFQQLRPLPVHKMLDFDWWVMRDAPESLMKRGQIVACYALGGIHVGYKKSLWSKWDTPEYPECRKRADELYDNAVQRYNTLFGSAVQGADVGGGS